MERIGKALGPVGRAFERFSGRKLSYYWWGGTS